MEQGILEFVNAMISSSGKTLEQVARDIGRGYSTLKRELNEFDDGAKLGAMQLIPIARACPDGLMHLAQYFATQAGARVVDLADVCPDKATLDEELLDDLPPLAALQTAMRERRPVEEVHALLQALIRDIEEDFVAYRKELAEPARRVA